MTVELTQILRLTEEDLAIIEHKVIDDPWTKDNPDMRVGEAWVRRVNAALGAGAHLAIVEKVQKYRAEYLAAVEAEGENYKNAAQREAIRVAEELARTEEKARQIQAAEEAEAKADEDRLRRLVAEGVEKKLAEIKGKE